MSFTPDQTQEIKKQLIKEVEKIPNADHEQIKKYIESLDENGLEEFLKKNKIQFSDSEKYEQKEKQIFKAIIDGEFKSYKLAENEKAVAILEINPLSKGHSIILPKKQTSVEKISKSAFSLAQKIAKKIKKKLKPEDIKIETFSFQDYPAINIIPIYKGSQLKKQKADEEELKKLQEKLETKKRAAKIKESQKEQKNIDQETKKEKLKEISFRIP